MAAIKPFQGLTYNQDKLKDLSKLICPPYDIISPQRQEYLHQLHQFNFIHVLLPQDQPGDDKYKRAGEIFSLWLKDKVLVQDAAPAVYFYSHQYSLKGAKYIRLGFIALLELDKGNASVFGHEHTRLEAKEDRLRMILQAKANLSPIFVVFPDKKRIIQKLYQQYVLDKKPFIEITDDEKGIHKLWRIDQPLLLAEIQSKMTEEKIFIADGHHRYEVACAFRDQMRQKSPQPQDASFDYVMAYFTNSDSRGLSILPIHRLVKFDAAQDANSLTAALQDYFDLEEAKDKGRLCFLLEKSGRREHVFGVYLKRKFFLLRLKNIRILDKLIPDKPSEFRGLDVAIFNYIILKKLLGSSSDDKSRISFNPEMEELIREVDRDPLRVAFFLNPAGVGQMMAVAERGNKMPPKSTYFYPKVASGLVVHKFGEL